MLTYEHIYQFIVDKYRDVFTSLYKINNDTLDEHLLYYLWDHNYIVLMPDKGSDPEIWFGESSVIGGISRYGYVRRGFARVPDQRYDQVRKQFNENNSVVMYSSKDKHSMYYRLDQALSEMASIMFFEQNNLRMSNIPGVIEATTGSSNTMKNIFSKLLLEPKSFIVVDDKTRISNDLGFTDFNVPYRASEYQNSFLFYHNQVLEIMGINFTPHEKKERLVTNEVDSNNELTQNNSDRFMERINRYFEQYNKLYPESEMIRIEKRVQEAPVPEKMEVDKNEL